ncbi:alpha/beta-hydrolase [Dentipellis sp. KUC8613]|nr:alpha/beta-hydrolase [Dentipellis sp. KUC8613]
MLFHHLSLALSAFVSIIPLSTFAYPYQEQNVLSVISKTPRPLVLWHGMGDSHSSAGMVQFQDKIKEIHPGIFVHSVYIEEASEADQRAGFYGNANDQIDLVAEQLKGIDELRDGFDALGFSQGGQFLRAYVERYNSPPVHNLITFGSQHMGVSDLPLCQPYDFLCRVARDTAKRNVYGTWAQEHLIQAQYYRDPDQLQLYLTSNHFLTSINNELSPESSSLSQRNVTYAQNIASLNKLVLIMFGRDKTVLPKESAWFGSYAQQSPDANEKTVIPMRLQPLYVEDWIGLRTLDEKGGVVLTTCDTEHMQLPTECWEPIVKQYVGGAV